MEAPPLSARVLSSRRVMPLALAVMLALPLAAAALDWALRTWLHLVTRPVRGRHTGPRRREADQEAQ